MQPNLNFEDLVADLRDRLEAGEFDSLVDMYHKKCIDLGESETTFSERAASLYLNETTDAVTKIVQCVLKILQTGDWYPRDTFPDDPFFTSPQMGLDVTCFTRGSQILPFPMRRADLADPHTYCIVLQAHNSMFAGIFDFGPYRGIGVKGIVITIDPDNPALHELGLAFSLPSQSTQDVYEAVLLDRQGICEASTVIVGLKQGAALDASLSPNGLPFKTTQPPTPKDLGNDIGGRLGMKRSQLARRFHLIVQGLLDITEGKT